MLLPRDVCEHISRRALELTRLRAPRRTGQGAARLQPIRKTGEVGIRVPGDVRYMLFQEHGIHSFVMHGLVRNRDPNTIPIRLPSGQVIFRQASSRTIGKRRIVTRDRHGRITAPDGGGYATKLRWWHPGLQPKLFMRRSILDAIDEWKRNPPPEHATALLVGALQLDNERIAQFIIDAGLRASP